MRPFWFTLTILNLGLAIAGYVYASQRDVAAALAVPIVAAFLLQASAYLIPGFPEARSRLEKRFKPPQIAALAVIASLLPYLVYSIPTSVFSWEAFGKLAFYCLFVTFLFVVTPPRANRLSWQDGLALGLLAWPEVSGVGFFHNIYVSPIPEMVGSLDSLGALMLIPLGATAFLSLRQLEGVDFRLLPTGGDLRVGVKNYLLVLPVAVPIAVGTGFATWGPRPIESWTYPFELVGTMLGIYAAVALAEEFAFRGITQNLLATALKRPLLAQLIASILFGLVHLPSRGFPNWRFALVSAVAGWFYGRAYAEQRSIVPAMITHTLVVVSWRFAFQT